MNVYETWPYDLLLLCFNTYPLVQQMTARAAALACHDILATIFDHLALGLVGRHPIDLDVDSRETQQLDQTCRQALCSSAIVSSTISHHALNVLWSELDNVQPLLKVLPNYKSVGSRFVSRSIDLTERDPIFTKRVLRHSVVQSYLKFGRGFNSMLIACALFVDSKNTSRLSSPPSGCSSQRSAKDLR